MQNNFAERLNYLITSYLKTNISDFESKINVGRGVVYNAINKNRNIGLDNIQKILTHCPEINADWLLTGEGAMIDGSHTLSDNNNLEVNANIRYQENSDLITKLSSALLSLTENDKIRAENERIQAQALYKITETNQVLATNETTHLEIQKQLVILLEKK